MSPKFNKVARLSFIESEKRQVLYAEQARHMGLDYSSWLRLGIKRFISRKADYKLSASPEDGTFMNPKAEMQDKVNWKQYAKNRDYSDFSQFVRSASYWFYSQIKSQNEKVKGA